MPFAAPDAHGGPRPADRRDGPSRGFPRSRRRARRPLPPGVSARLCPATCWRDRAAYRRLCFLHRRKCQNMKIASFKAAGVASYGIVTDAGVIDAGKRLKDFPTLKALLARGSLDELKKLQGERADYALKDVEMLP